MSKKTTKVGAKSQTKYLRLISGNEGLILDPRDGKRTLAKANDIFSYIYPGFEKWRANEPGEATEKTLIDIYEMVENATFTQMFGSLSRETKQLCLTQDQIIGFVMKYRQWLRDEGFETYFLFESYGQFFVAKVHHESYRLDVYIDRFECSDVSDAEGYSRLVVPRLA